MSKAKTKKTRKHSFILAVCFISLAIVFVISLISINKEIQARKAEVTQLQSDVAAQEAENESLEKMVESGDRDEYVEKVAREKYGYIKPGDHVYQDIAAGE